MRVAVFDHQPMAPGAERLDAQNHSNLKPEIRYQIV